MKCIPLDYGADDPLVLEVDEAAIAAECRGPEGGPGRQAADSVAAALLAPADGPPLEAHVVGGDRVAIALVGDVPQRQTVVAAVLERLATGGVRPEDTLLLHAPAFEQDAAGHAHPPRVPGLGAWEEFDPAVDANTSYVAADAAGRAIHLARKLVDADVVVSIGACGWDASFGGRALDGELWPAFARGACRRELVRSLAVRGRRALPAWRSANREAAWHLGVSANLRLIAGRGDTLFAACFGLPGGAVRAARSLAAAWRPRVDRPARLAVASLSDPRGGLPLLRRAVAAAARVTYPDGTICVASRLAEKPGIVFSRWREGAPLQGLVREAVGSGDATLIHDAFQTRFFARALGDRRLVLLSDLDQATVEGLELGYAATPETVERLAHRSDSIVVLQEADRMLPRTA